MVTGLEGKRIWKRSFRAESSSESEEKETVKGREVKKTNLRDIRESEQSEEGDGSG